MTFKVTTIDSMYTYDITTGINYMKVKASQRKTIICKMGEVINISKYDKVAVIAYRKEFREFYIILNYYNKI